MSHIVDFADWCGMIFIRVIIVLFAISVGPWLLTLALGLVFLLGPFGMVLHLVRGKEEYSIIKRIRQFIMNL